jgi:ABC-type transporter Mla subunit MlaD
MENTKIYDDATKAIKDAGYVAVGLGVMAFQKAQVRRREVLDSLKSNSKGFSAQVDEARSQVAKVVKTVETKLDPVVGQIESRLDEVEDKLPETAKNLVRQARQQSRQTNDQIRSWLFGSAA